MGATPLPPSLRLHPVVGQSPVTSPYRHSRVSSRLSHPNQCKLDQCDIRHRTHSADHLRLFLLRPFCISGRRHTSFLLWSSKKTIFCSLQLSTSKHPPTINLHLYSTLICCLFQTQLFVYITQSNFDTIEPSIYTRNRCCSYITTPLDLSVISLLLLLLSSPLSLFVSTYLERVCISSCNHL